jgi:integrase
VSKVDTAHVLRALEPIWTEKAETASRLRARIERVLAWATVSGYRKGDNPARWRGHLDELLPKIERRKRVKHHPALPYPQMGEFTQELRAEDGTPARALEFAILTAARTSEVIGARPAEFDLEAAVWTIPAERMKSHRRHKVPLSARAVAIVREALKAGGEYLFRAPAWCRTASGRRSAPGRPSRRTTRATFAKWRWRTSSATRPRPRTSAVTCSRSGAGSWPRGRVSVIRP